MAFRDTLSKFTGFFHHATNAACLTEKDIATARQSASAAFPDRCGWHPLRYPGEVSLPIFLVPLAPPLPPQMHAVVVELHGAIRKEGFPDSQIQIRSRSEQRQAHLWLAMLAKDQYMPIGQATFILKERRYAEDAPATGSSEPNELRLNQRESQRIARQWWLHHAWLRPAYRCQLIFRHSVPYLNEWHPDFLVRDPFPPLARALKEHPGHVFDATVEWF